MSVPKIYMVYIEVIPLYIIRNVCMFTSSYHWKGIITNEFFMHQKLKASNVNIFTYTFLHLDVLASIGIHYLPFLESLFFH